MGLVFFLSLTTSTTGWTSSVNVGDVDDELGTDARTVQLPTDIDAPFMFKETVFHADGVTPRVIKTAYKNRQNYWVLGTVPYVLYEHFRADGTMSKDHMVFPDNGLGGGVYTKYRLRLYDSAGKQLIEERYLREDKTTGVIMDRLKDTFTQLRADGQTLRLVQERLDGNRYRTTYYRLDGKTPWWVSEDGSTKVYFDEHGNAVKKEFTSRRLAAWGAIQYGVAYREDTYTRPDRTVEYKQTWYAHEANGYFDAIGEVELYAADGRTVTARIKLELRHPDKGLFIKSVQFINADGSKLVRLYQAPGCRLSEETFDANGASTAKKSFGTSDRFNESFPKVIFQGFHLHTRPEYDTDQSTDQQ